ncbi:unnamed protein product [Diabrotica balteata]|uniref:DUF3456 domain-containing protein n=1 Tax=Diabrotica balteata TaxID=107213 RepID=A0A9N9TFU0_DIABA|nr:unnamed protein product [Diabrotica balteata]
MKTTLVLPLLVCVGLTVGAQKNDFYCDTCVAFASAIKELVLEEVPLLSTISSKRSNNMWRNSKINYSRMTEEEIREMMDSITTDEESEYDDEDYGEFVDDSDYLVETDDEVSSSKDELTKDKDNVINECLSDMQRLSSAEFLTKSTELDLNVTGCFSPMTSTPAPSPKPATSKNILSVSTVGVLSATVTESKDVQPSIAAATESGDVQPSTSAGSTECSAIYLEQKPMKRAKSPLPENEPEGPQMLPNNGGFIGQAIPTKENSQVGPKRSRWNTPRPSVWKRNVENSKRVEGKPYKSTTGRMQAPKIPKAVNCSKCLLKRTGSCYVKLMRCYMDLHPGNMLLEVLEDVEVLSEEEIPENLPCTSALDTSWERYSTTSLQQPVAEKLSTPRGGEILANMF